MKQYLLVALFTLAAAADYYPVAVRNANTNQYVAFGKNLYSFGLPGLSLLRSSAFDGTTFAYPGSLAGNTLFFGDGANGRYEVNTASFSSNYYATTPAPASSYNFIPPTCVKDTANINYCFNSSGENSFISKISADGAVLLTKTIPKGSLTSVTLYNLLQIEGSALYLSAAQPGAGRGSTDYQFYIFETATLSVTHGPVVLPKTATSGCPVPARECSVPVLNNLSVYNGTVVYLWTISASPAFQVNIVSYAPSCGFSSNSFDDQGTEPTYSGTSTCPAVPTPIDCGNLRLCGTGLCYNPARQFCCNGVTGFYYIDGQFNPAATCPQETSSSAASTKLVSETLPFASYTSSSPSASSNGQASASASNGQTVNNQESSTDSGNVESTNVIATQNRAQSNATTSTLALFVVFIAAVMTL